MTGTELQLIKHEKFGEVQADIYSDSKEMFMTINQLSECLEYASTAGIGNIITRNPYINSSEFSTTHKMCVVEGKRTVTREIKLFNEDGIYEITFLAKTEVAKKFRTWVRGILKALRNGEIQLSSGGVSIIPEVLASKIDQLVGFNAQLVKNNKELASSISFIKSEIFKMAYAPSNSEWKRKINAKIIEISKETESSCSSTLAWICQQMKEKGYDIVKLIHQYEFENGLQTPCPTMEFLDKNDEAKKQFEILLDEMVAKTFKNSSIHGNVSTTNIHIGKAQEEPAAPTTIDTPSIVDPLKAAMQPLIEKYSDCTKGGNHTYRKVYAAMGVGWQIRQTRYKNEHKLKNQPKKMTLIENDKKLMKLYLDTINELIAEA